MSLTQPAKLREFVHQTAIEMLSRMPAERLKEITVEDRLDGLTPEERVSGLTPEERVSGLTPEEIFAALSPEMRAALTRFIEASVNG
jgi:hypothetical protein